MIGCPNDQLFLKIMNVLDLQEQAKDPRFATYGSRKANERALLDAIEPAVASRQVGELVEALSALGVPCSKVNSYKDVFEKAGKRYEAHIAPQTRLDQRTHRQLSSFEHREGE